MLLDPSFSFCLKLQSFKNKKKNKAWSYVSDGPVPAYHEVMGLIPDIA